MKQTLIVLLLYCFSIPFFDAKASTEDAPLRSAFIFQFTKYIEWPTNSEQFLIDVIGDQELFEAIKSNTSGKKVGESTITVRFTNSENFSSSQFLKSQIVILPTGSTKEIRSNLASLKKLSVLTISYGDGMAADGSIINFIMSDNHLRFEINQQAAENKKIKIRSQLLRLGKAI
jgi:hypothetical protein